MVITNLFFIIFLFFVMLNIDLQTQSCYLHWIHVFPFSSIVHEGVKLFESEISLDNCMYYRYYHDATIFR